MIKEMNASQLIVRSSRHLRQNEVLGLVLGRSSLESSLPLSIDPDIVSRCSQCWKCLGNRCPRMKLLIVLDRKVEVWGPVLGSGDVEGWVLR